MPRYREAFTLLELLVCLGIICLLSTLGLVAYQQAHIESQEVESISQMRQWGVALMDYVGDNNGALPRRGQGVQPVTQLNRPEDWFNALPPYLGLKGYGELVQRGQLPHAGDHSLFVRPGAQDPGGAAFLSYGMNMNLSPWNLPAPTKIAEVIQPASVVFLAETPGPYASTYPSAQPYSCIAPHGGRGNILFLDGHVSTFSADYLGVNKGNPEHDDVRWLTGTASDAQAHNY